ncbi:MAG: type I-F CRISPR-associated endoribonuclease Cas6/Csy4 [Reinekea sp.]|jgi:CRISPR-associated endonuclease Csy4
MEYYQEIKILADPELTETVLMNALFAKLHRALVAMKADTIGISFPKVMQKKRVNLGNLIRLHGSEADLNALDELNWRKGLSDYTHVRAIQPVPLVREYRQVKRIQAKSNAERLRRRLIKRKGVSEAQAQQQIPDNIEQELKLPFVTLKSSSTNQQFRLFIDQSCRFEQAQPGPFSKYGLSFGVDGATVPWF